MNGYNNDGTVANEETLPPNILSIQSHVVHGKVGNTAAMFPLQLLGFDVHAINSVQFSNHTGYPVVKGSVLGGNDLDELMDGLVVNSICEFDYLLTGYIGSETFLTSILRTLDIIYANNPNVKYICDPVLGDAGKLYVPEKLINIYIEKILPRAYMITPNQMEVEYLSGIKTEKEEDVVRALKKLYVMGPDIVICTSADLIDAPGKLYCYIVHCPNKPVNNDEATDRNTHVLEISRVIVNKLTDNHYTGTGDVTAALLLGWIHRLSTTGGVMPDGVSIYGLALLNSLCTIQCMLSRAQRNAKRMQALANVQYDKNGTAPEKSIPNSKYVELPIVGSKCDIENPPTSSYFQLEGPQKSIYTWRI